MLKEALEMNTVKEYDAEGGSGLLKLKIMSDYFDKPAKLSTFAFAELDPGAEVGFHVHEGESECYYILSGKGLYNDNGDWVPAKSGDVTFTPAGTGHGLKNTGSEKMTFMALVILE